MLRIGGNGRRDIAKTLIISATDNLFGSSAKNLAQEQSLAHIFLRSCFVNSITFVQLLGGGK
eukprot:snap_masked-scaffold_2-processed-gene-3.23-mRNA-1 protein AED:1.00 eAED:1.00 QI:0/-1/0/0/-1/1/1/0/61